MLQRLLVLSIHLMGHLLQLSVAFIGTFENLVNTFAAFS